MSIKFICSITINNASTDLYIDEEYFAEHVQRDHGISVEMVRDMATTASFTVPVEGFRSGCCTVDCGRVIGKDNLVVTDASDIIVMFARGNRAPSRMVPYREAEDTSKMVLVVGYPPEAEYEGKLVLYTAYPGTLGEREPNERMTEAELAKSKAFWACHALVPTKDQLAQMKEAGLLQPSSMMVTK